jgi:hypothetical protein
VDIRYLRIVPFFRVVEGFRQSILHALQRHAKPHFVQEMEWKGHIQENFLQSSLQLVDFRENAM